MYQQQPPPHAYLPPEEGRNGFGVTALVLGIVGLCLGIIPILGLVAIILGILGGVFGILGYARRASTNKKMSIIATLLSLGAIGLGFWGIVTVARAVDDLQRDINQFNEQLSSVMPTPIVLPT